MNGPTLSLLDANNINPDVALDSEDEEESLADQRRRNEELGNLLQNAFDDLEDDETTVDSTTNFSEFTEGNVGDVQQDQRHIPSPKHEDRPLSSEVEYQMKMLLESKIRELENVKDTAIENQKKCNEMQKRLNLVEAELGIAVSTNKNTHELLVASKEKCSNLESTITKLCTEKKQLETENNTLRGNLETAQTMLADIHCKYDMVERDLRKYNERSADQRLKQIEIRHGAEVGVLQQQIEQLSSKLESKSSELEGFDVRYRALQSTHESMLAERDNTIKELNRALAETDKMYQELVFKQKHFQIETMALKLNSFNNENLQEIDNLVQELHNITCEVELIGRLKINAHQKELINKLKRKTHKLEQFLDRQNILTEKQNSNSTVKNMEVEQLHVKELQEKLHAKEMDYELQAKEMHDKLKEIENKFKLQENEKKELQDKLQEIENNFQEQENEKRSLHNKIQENEAQLKSQEKEKMEILSKLQESEMEFKLQLKEAESRIRNQMAKVFFLELKRLQVKLIETDERGSNQQHAYQQAVTELQHREMEINLLKQAILAEREKMQEIIKSKNLEQQHLLEEQNDMLLELRNEIKLKSQAILELRNEFRERQEQIEVERNSVQDIMCKWQKLRKQLGLINNEWQKKFNDIKSSHKSEVMALQKKYNSVKRSVDHYKRYSKDQETHMRKEYERIKLEYESSLAKMELRIKEALDKKRNGII